MISADGEYPNRSPMPRVRSSRSASGRRWPAVDPTAGQSLLTSPDIQACVALAQKGKS